MSAWNDANWSNSTPGPGGPPQQPGGQGPDWVGSGWDQPQARGPENSGSKGPIIALVAVSVAFLLTLAGGATYFLTQGDDTVAAQETGAEAGSADAQGSGSGAGSADDSDTTDGSSNADGAGSGDSDAAVETAGNGIADRAPQHDAPAQPAPAPAPAPASASRYAAPACDGRGVLIYESVVVSPGTSASSLLEAALARYPGSVYTDPGRCPSLRASLNGQTIYPVFVDYGFDTASLCSAAAGSSANPRILSNRAEYLSPC